MKQITFLIAMNRSTSIIIFLLLLTSCLNFFKEEQLIGEYYLNNGNNNDLIILNEDHTYLHRYKTNFGKQYESSGTWEYDNGYGKIVFDGFVFYDEEGSKNRPDGTWGSSVSVNRNGEIKLYYSTENEIYYTNSDFHSP